MSRKNASTLESVTGTQSVTSFGNVTTGLNFGLVQTLALAKCGLSEIPKSPSQKDKNLRTPAENAQAELCGKFWNAYASFARVALHTTLTDAGVKVSDEVITVIDTWVRQFARVASANHNAFPAMTQAEQGKAKDKDLRAFAKSAGIDDLEIARTIFAQVQAMKAGK